MITNDLGRPARCCKLLHAFVVKHISRIFYLRMELRSKRLQSQPKPAASQRRRIVDNSHRENLLRMLIIEPNTDNTAGHLRFPGKFRLLVKGDWWAKFYPDTSKIPLYILEKLYDEKNRIDSLAEMELVHEFIPPTKEFIVEEMSSKGVIFLQTSTCESEMAITTIGRLAMGGNALTILGPEQQQTQYLTHIPAGLLAEQVYDVQRESPNGPYKTGDRLRFSEDLQTIEHCSSMVHEAIYQRVKGFSTVWRASVHGNPDPRHRSKIPAVLHVGMGFVTRDGRMGVITSFSLDDSLPAAHIHSWIPLVNTSFLQNVKGAIEFMEYDQVVTTNLEIDDPVSVDEVTGTFLLQPLALSTSANSGSSPAFPHGDKFIAGHLIFPLQSNQDKWTRLREGDFSGLTDKEHPLVLHGVKAMTGSTLLKIICMNNQIFKGLDFKPYLPAIRAQMEDALLVMANTKAEDWVGSRNTIRFHDLPAQAIMSAVYCLSSIHYEAQYDSNCLTVNFDDVSPGREDVSEEELDDLRNICWLGLERLLGRNFFRTTLPQQGGDVIKLGFPKFKYMLLPREEVVVTMEFVELLTPGETIAKFTNRATRESKREFNKTHSNSKFCSHCFRRFATLPGGVILPTHGCTCVDPAAHADSDEEA
jgi:hypothetical protein